MKTFKILAMIMILGCSTQMSAQQVKVLGKGSTSKAKTTATTKSTATKSTATKSTAAKSTAAKTTATKTTTTRTTSSSSYSGGEDKYNVVYFQYNPCSLSSSGNGGSGSTSVNGVTLGLSRFTSLNDDATLFLDYGVAVQYFWKKFSNGFGGFGLSGADLYDDDDLDDYGDLGDYGDLSDYVDLSSYASYGGGGHESTLWMLSIKVPVHVSYRFEIPNSSVMLSPFGGAYARFNAVGKMKTGSESIDIFKKQDGMDAAKRFQFGLEFGLGAQFGEKIYANLAYAFDLNPIWDFSGVKTKLNTGALTIGYIF